MKFSTRLTDDKLLVLLFHGVIPEQTHPVRNYTAKHITRDRFIEILRDLKSAGGASLSMAEVMDLSRTKQPWPQRAFAVTFDDGFANNHTVAAPVLDEMKISATFYLTTKFVESGACSWTDMIEYAVEKSHGCALNLPALNIHGQYSTIDAKIGLLGKIRNKVKADPQVDPYKIADEIWRQLGVIHMDPDDQLDRKMNWAQAQELERHPRFTVGGHGHTHRILSYLSPVELEQEFNESFFLLKKHLRKPLEHYSYPEGLRSCYSPAVIESLKKRGIQCCPSAEDGLNGPEEDLFELKRVMVI